jgi:two-component system, OmpR family, sensor histidine kinase KdpD
MGVLLAVVSVAAATAIVYPLKGVAPAVSLSAVYVPVVLLISAYWGLVLGLLTALASAAAFNFFQLPPVGTFQLADGRDWVALAVFTIVAAAVSAVANLARGRAVEAERRRSSSRSPARGSRSIPGSPTDGPTGTPSRGSSTASSSTG